MNAIVLILWPVRNAYEPGVISHHTQDAASLSLAVESVRAGVAERQDSRMAVRDVHSGGMPPAPPEGRVVVGAAIPPPLLVLGGLGVGVSVSALSSVGDGVAAAPTPQVGTSSRQTLASPL